MSMEALRERLAAVDSSVDGAAFATLAVELANALSDLGQRPGGFDDNARAVGLLHALEYLVLREHSPDLELAFRKACFYTWSDRYDGDRELNLREAIAQATRAIELIEARQPLDEEQFGAFLNDMGNCYLRANYAGAWPLEHAAACYRRGLGAVSAERFPRLHDMLWDNLEGAEAHLASGRHGLPGHETARRFDYAIQHAFRAGGPSAAMPEVWAYLHWAWSLPAEPNVHLASAYTQLANFYAAAGHIRESVPYIYCAIALCTSAERATPAWHGLLEQARQVLEKILAALGQSHKAVELSGSARGGFHSAREAWQTGNQCLAKNPAQALEAYEQALSHFPLWPAGLHARGLAHLLLNNPAAAVEDFTASLHFLPDQPKTLLARSRAHALMGAAGPAAADLERARQLDPSIPGALAGKAGSGA